MVRLFAILTVLTLTTLAIAADEPKKKVIDVAAEFKKLDANTDKKLSKEEFAKFTPANKKAAANFKADEVFGKLDADKDGTVTEDEFKKFTAARNSVNLAGQFVTLDADKDKKLSKEEFAKFTPANKKVAATFKADETFTKLDADKDGSVSQKEFAKVLRTTRKPKQ